MEQAELILLINKSRQGDPDAQEKLVMETQNRVYYHCKKFLKNEEDALDATQDVLIAMITSLDKLREPAAFWGWVNGITARRCKHLLTRGTKEWQIPEDDEGNSMLDSIETLDDQTVPDKVMDTAETQRLILDIIDGLPSEQRMTVTSAGASASAGAAAVSGTAAGSAAGTSTATGIAAVLAGVLAVGGIGTVAYVASRQSGRPVAEPTQTAEAPSPTVGSPGEDAASAHAGQPYSAPYARMVRELEEDNSGLRYDLVYIDEDDVPELIASTEYNDMVNVLKR